MCSRAVDDVVALQRRDRDHDHVERAPERVELRGDLVEALLRPVDEIHLVDGDDGMWHPQDREDVRVAAGLLDDALARVDEHDPELGGRSAGDHVARVLHVARRVGELEASPRRDEGAIGDVDRDALLALGAQAVGEEREVDVAVTAAARDVLDVLELVDEDLLRVVEQPPDQGGLAVVDRAACDEAKELGRLRSLRNSQRASCLPSLPR